MLLFFVSSFLALTRQQDAPIEFTLQNSQSYTSQLIELNSSLLGTDFILQCFVEKYLTLLEFYQMGVLLTFHNQPLNYSTLSEVLSDQNALFDIEAILSGSFWHNIKIQNLNQTTLVLHVFDFDQIPPQKTKFQMYKVKISPILNIKCKNNCSAHGSCAKINKQQPFTYNCSIDQCICHSSLGSYCQFPVYQLSYVHPIQIGLFQRSWAIINVSNLTFEINQLELKFKGLFQESYYYYIDFRSLSISEISSAINRSSYFAYKQVTFNIASDTKQILIFNLKEDILSINGKLKLTLLEHEEYSFKGKFTYILAGLSTCIALLFVLYWCRCRQLEASFNAHTQLSQSTTRIRKKLDSSFLNLYLPRQDYEKIMMLQPHLNYIKECVVCLEVLNERNEQCSLLPCGHLYHFLCIQQWLQKKNICPQCKIIFKEEDFQQRDNILIEALQNPYVKAPNICKCRMPITISGRHG